MRRNPLAAARLQGNKNNKSSTSSSTTAAAAVLWHYKTGAGFQLFVDYYYKQQQLSSSGVSGSSGGLVCEEEEPATLEEHDNDKETEDSGVVMRKNNSKRKQPVITSASSLSLSSGPGLSRAAKRRKKKKMQGGIAPISDTHNNHHHAEDMPRAAAATNDKKTLAVSEPQEDTPLYTVNARLASIIMTLAPQTQNQKQQKHAENNHQYLYDSSPPAFTTFLQILMRPLPITFRIRTHLEDSTQHVILKTIQELLVDDDSQSEKKKEQAAAESSESNHNTASSSTTSLLLSDNECTCNNKSDNNQSTVRIVSLLSSSNSPAAGSLLLAESCCMLHKGSNLSHTTTTLLSISNAKQLSQNKQLAQLLQDYSANGSLARQELASMLPVMAIREYVYGQQQHDTQTQQQPITIRRILDLCSAPGSKTLQLVEWMMELRKRQQLSNSSNNNNNNNNNNKPFLIRANDVHPERLVALQEAMQRSGLKYDDAVVVKYTNQDASQYSDASGSTKKKKLYDIILADVPCSGDGTVRKDARILPYWTPQTSNALHSLQVKILSRALKLVAVKGIVVYSTCSMNPMENEAVVSAVLTLKQYAGKFQVLPVSLPGLLLKQRQGVTRWGVADYTVDDARSRGGGDTAASGDDNEKDDMDTEQPHLTWYATYDEARAAGMEHSVPSMWPPGESTRNESAVEQNLKNCLRLWPQDHDTGGFFVAMIQRME
jgi:16S rRNA C967 or C1407 C5-methylase (RsmB/RsmF family)